MAPGHPVEREQKAPCTWMSHRLGFGLPARAGSAGHMRPSEKLPAGLVQTPSTSQGGGDSEPVWSLVWWPQEGYVAERTELPPQPLTGLPAASFNSRSQPVP